MLSSFFLRSLFFVLSSFFVLHFGFEKDDTRFEFEKDDTCSGFERYVRIKVFPFMYYISRSS